MTHEIGDAPIEKKYRDLMLTIAEVLDEFLNGKKVKKGDRKTGFVLLVFPYNDHGGRCNYISNGARREDIVVLMKEQIVRFEGQPDTEGTA